MSKEKVAKPEIPSEYRNTGNFLLGALGVANVVGVTKFSQYMETSPGRIASLAFVVPGFILVVRSMEKFAYNSQIRMQKTPPWTKKELETDICNEDALFDQEEQDKLNRDLAGLDSAKQAAADDAEADFIERPDDTIINDLKKRFYDPDS